MKWPVTKDRKLVIVGGGILVLSVALLCISLAVSGIIHARAESAEAQRAADDRESKKKSMEAFASFDYEESKRSAIAEIAAAEAKHAAIDSFHAEGYFNGKSLDYLLVNNIEENGKLATDYGLRRGDQIISVNGRLIGEVSMNNPDIAKTMVVQNGYEARVPIVVIREGKQITLLWHRR
ncbi:MAG TPA: hypothetical protein VIM11_14310 [Tepidisphaeraceae bacterium]|jgi:C-terminal processing protease CtpA/Prc